MTSWRHQRFGALLLGALGSLLVGSLLATAAAAADFRSLDDAALLAECERLDAEWDAVAPDAWGEVARRWPASSYPLWREARAHHRVGERLPLDARAERLASYDHALAAARRGRSLDPECGECCLYEFAALGRTISIQGFTSAVAQLGEMSALVPVCEAIPPSHADSLRNQERANLWYGFASFYRAVPDSRWIRMFTGARGDPARAVEYVERAVAAAPDRIDYRVELGASLLCLGRQERNPAIIRRGEAALHAAGQLSIHSLLDAIDRHHAALLLQRPDSACGYSRDRWPAEEDVLVGSNSSASGLLNASAPAAQP